MLNFEVNAFIYDRDYVNKIADQFYADQEDSIQLLEEDYRLRNMWVSLDNGGISSFIVNMFVLVFVLYFLLIGGKKMEQYVNELLPFNERLFPLSTLYPVLALIMEAASSKGAMTACGSRLMFCRFTTDSHTTNARGTRKHKIASAVMTVAAMLRFIFRFSDR